MVQNNKYERQDFAFSLIVQLKIRLHIWFHYTSKKEKSGFQLKVMNTAIFSHVGQIFPLLLSALLYCNFCFLYANIVFNLLIPLQAVSRLAFPLKNLQMHHPLILRLCSTETSALFLLGCVAPGLISMAERLQLSFST